MPITRSDMPYRRQLKHAKTGEHPAILLQKIYINRFIAKSMESVIFVGNKAPIKYATAIVTEFEKGPSEVMVKARGRSISTAVDACQISMNKFLEGVEVKDIKIFTEELEDRNVSAIEILLGKVGES